MRGCGAGKDIIVMGLVFPVNGRKIFFGKSFWVIGIQLYWSLEDLIDAGVLAKYFVLAFGRPTEPRRRGDHGVISTGK
jgi:hypothetical protein